MFIRDSVREKLVWSVWLTFVPLNGFFCVIIVGAVGFGGVRVRVRACFFRWLLGVGVVAVCVCAWRRPLFTFGDGRFGGKARLIPLWVIGEWGHEHTCRFLCLYLHGRVLLACRSIEERSVRSNQLRVPVTEVLDVVSRVVQDYMERPVNRAQIISEILLHSQGVLPCCTEPSGRKRILLPPLILQLFGKFVVDVGHDDSE